MSVNAWQWWSAAQIAAATGSPIENVAVLWPLLAADLDRRGILDRPNAIGMIATVAIETGGPDPALRFSCVREAYWLSEAWRKANLRYWPFYGRGPIQATWRETYAAFGEDDGVGDLYVREPDRLLDPAIGARFAVWFWATKGVPAKDGGRWYSLPELCREGDWEWVRRCVQGGTVGLDRLRELVAALDEIKEPGPMPIYLHTTDELNLRDRPSVVESTVLATVPSGTVVEALDERAWRSVRLVDGTEGWMAQDFLELGDVGFGQPTTVPLANKTGPQLTFNASTPTELQVQDWTCSIRSTMWLLRAIGIDVTPAEAEDALSPRYVNAAVGLLDASGAGIVQVLSDRWHVAAFNRNPVSFDEVAEHAGQRPVAIGGRAWGHWTAVRGFDGGRLVLANPGGTGPRYGQQTLDRGQFAQLGSFSMVVVTGRL